MARILISEPHPDVRRLLVRMVSRLGHEPVLDTPPQLGCLDGVELLIVEPAAPMGAVLAKAARIMTPSLPIVCASVAAPPQIDVAFAAGLVKPFTFEQLAEAIERALAGPDRAGRATGH